VIRPCPHGDLKLQIPVIHLIPRGSLVEVDEVLEKNLMLQPPWQPSRFILPFFLKGHS